MINLDKSLIVQLINFLLLLFLLYRFAYKPLLAKLEERSSTIKRQLEEASRAREEAELRAEEYRAKLLTAQREAQVIRDRALKEAQEEQRRLLAEAKGEAERIVSAARAQIQQDVSQARSELRREVGALATEIAEKLIRKSLRDEDHHRFIQETIARLERV
ncbi:MAG TPA: F0F1 ATP synthase subunit B [Methylomirabilota bacterium]|nr:F0F1 ATP synthase subunit B [Methylomirabilota bacterium]